MYKIILLWLLCAKFATALDQIIGRSSGTNTAQTQSVETLTLSFQFDDTSLDQTDPVTYRPSLVTDGSPDVLNDMHTRYRPYVEYIIEYQSDKTEKSLVYEANAIVTENTVLELGRTVNSNGILTTTPIATTAIFHPSSKSNKKNKNNKRNNNKHGRSLKGNTEEVGNCSDNPSCAADQQVTNLADASAREQFNDMLQFVLLKNAINQTYSALNTSNSFYQQFQAALADSQQYNEMLTGQYGNLTAQLASYVQSLDLVNTANSNIGDSLVALIQEKQDDAQVIGLTIAQQLDGLAELKLQTGLDTNILNLLLTAMQSFNDQAAAQLHVALQKMQIGTLAAQKIVTNAQEVVAKQQDIQAINDILQSLILQAVDNYLVPFLVSLGRPAGPAPLFAGNNKWYQFGEYQLWLHTDSNIVQRETVQIWCDQVSLSQNLDVNFDFFSINSMFSQQNCNVDLNSCVCFLFQHSQFLNSISGAGANAYSFIEDHTVNTQSLADLLEDDQVMINNSPFTNPYNLATTQTIYSNGVYPYANTPRIIQGGSNVFAYIQETCNTTVVANNVNGGTYEMIAWASNQTTPAYLYGNTNCQQSLMQLTSSSVVGNTLQVWFYQMIQYWIGAENQRLMNVRTYVNQGNLPFKIQLETTPFRYTYSATNDSTTETNTNINGTITPPPKTTVSRVDRAAFLGVSPGSVPVFRFTQRTVVAGVLVQRDPAAQPFIDPSTGLEAPESQLYTTEIELYNTNFNLLPDTWNWMGNPICQYKLCPRLTTDIDTVTGQILDYAHYGGTIDIDTANYIYNIDPSEISTRKLESSAANTFTYLQHFNPQTYFQLQNNTWLMNILQNPDLFSIPTMDVLTWQSQYVGEFNPYHDRSLHTRMVEVIHTPPPAVSLGTPNLFDFTCIANRPSQSLPCRADDYFFMDFNLTRGTVRFYARDPTMVYTTQFMGGPLIPPPTLNACPTIDIENLELQPTRIIITNAKPFNTSSMRIVASVCSNITASAIDPYNVVNVFQIPPIRQWSEYRMSTPGCRNQAITVYADQEEKIVCKTWNANPQVLPIAAVRSIVVSQTNVVQGDFIQRYEEIALLISQALHVTDSMVQQTISQHYNFISDAIQAQYEQETNAIIENLINQLMVIVETLKTEAATDADAINAINQIQDVITASLLSVEDVSNALTEMIQLEISRAHEVALENQRIQVANEALQALIDFINELKPYNVLFAGVNANYNWGSTKNWIDANRQQPCPVDWPDVTLNAWQKFLPGQWNMYKYLIVIWLPVNIILVIMLFFVPCGANMKAFSRYVLHDDETMYRQI
jgi:hypothetical protein